MRTQVPHNDNWKPKKQSSSAPVLSKDDRPFVSPTVKARQSRNSSPSLDDETVLETPSPGGTGFFSPETIRVKVLNTVSFVDTPETSQVKVLDRVKVFDTPNIRNEKRNKIQVSFDNTPKAIRSKVLNIANSNSENTKKTQRLFDESPDKDTETPYEVQGVKPKPDFFASMRKTATNEKQKACYGKSCDSGKPFDESPDKGSESPNNERSGQTKPDSVLTRISPCSKNDEKNDIENGQNVKTSPLVTPLFSESYVGAKLNEYLKVLHSPNDDHIPHSKQTITSRNTIETTSTSKEKINFVAPSPFVSPGAPTQIQFPSTQQKGSISAQGKNTSFSLSLSEQVALAQKIGIAETQARVSESQESINNDSFTDSYFTSSDNDDDFQNDNSSNESLGESNAIEPNFLFEPATKNDRSYDNSNVDIIDRILSREVEIAAVDAALESEFYKSPAAEISFGGMEPTPDDEPGALVPASLWKLEEAAIQEDNEVPFDCTDDESNLYDSFGMSQIGENNNLQYVEEGKNPNKSKNVAFQKIIRNCNGSIAGITIKKEPYVTKFDTAGKVLDQMRNIRDRSTISPLAKVENDDNKLQDGFLDEPLTYLLAANDDASFDMSSIKGPPRYSMYHESPENDKNEPYSENTKRRSTIWRILFHIFALILLIICGTIAGLFASGILPSKTLSNSSNTSGKSVEETDANLVIGNATKPPIENNIESNVFEGSEIVACENAVLITDMNRPYYGSNWKAFWDETIDMCGDQMSTGYAVWYSFTTNSSKLVEASTCNNADFDTQVTVMSDSCKKPTCVAYNDQACGDQSLVTWYAEAFKTYYIMVHGYREASGTFGLTMTESFHNNRCDDALIIDTESIVSGTTAGAKSLDQPAQCGNVELSENGVWYHVGNITGFYRAEILRGYTEFSGQLSVYRSMDGIDSGCGTLICEKGNSTGSVMWLAEAKQNYYIYVNGNYGTAGAFDLFVGQNKASTCSVGTRLHPNSVGYLASTKNSNPQNVESCGYTGYHTAPGVWFSVEGTGGILEASTCGSLTDLDTQVSVFGGDCDSLECIGGTGQDYPCGDNGSVSWKTEIEKIYHIYVSGRSSRVGDFVLNINDIPMLDGYTCDGSLLLENESISVQSNTTIAPSEPIALCDGTRAVRGIWHSFVGTGKAMNISVCNDETDFNARISIFTGSSCEGLSCVAHTNSRCGDLLITTHVQVTYYILVHGPDSYSIGNYVLTIDATDINDSCDNAPTLDFASSTQYFGSTLSASNSTIIGCSGSENLISENQALWYRFPGTGDIVTLSTCSDLTDFTTSIRIYQGSCNAFGCVSNIENINALNNCAQHSTVSFQSSIDEVYFARIGGHNIDDKGNFLMEVTHPSPFFQP